MTAFFEIIYRFFNSMGIFSIEWQEAVLIVLSAVIILLAFLKILPANIAVPFGAGMLISNLTGLFNALPALPLDSELYILLLILYFWFRGAESEFSWIIRKPSLLLYGITAQTGFFLVLASPLLFADTELLAGSTVPFLVFIYASLLPVIQRPVTRFMISDRFPSETEDVPVKVSAGKRLTVMLIVFLVTGMIVPASIPLCGMYLLGCILKYPKHLSSVQAVLWFCTGLAAHSSMIFREDIIRFILLGIAALLVSALFGGLLSRLMMTLSDGRMYPDRLSKAVDSSSVFGILIASGVLISVM
ncbi:MAG: sodium ion-translocating decarboxylase subunit beta [Oscillospiraceae bacterium]|nr:sodium ion-translocating decarboxylase subunit beta [Oscillospiraceae bacterium]